MAEAEYARLHKHLFGGKTEQAAFGLAKPASEPNGDLALHELYLIPANEFAVQTSFHIELLPIVQERMIKAAFDSGSSLVEFHSHRSRYLARFSGSDMLGFREFVPHILWRLPGRPYVAVVLHERSLDGLLWALGERPAEQLEGIVAGGNDVAATRDTLKQDLYD